MKRKLLDKIELVVGILSMIVCIVLLISKFNEPLGLCHLYALGLLIIGKLVFIHDSIKYGD